MLLRSRPAPARPSRAVPRTALLLLLLLLPSCATVRYPPPAGEPLSLREGEALVLGRVLVHDGDHEIHPWGGDYRESLAEAAGWVRVPRVRLSLLRVESGEKAVFPRVEGDGSFAWVLPRGAWLLYVTRLHPSPSNEVVAAFAVPPGPSAVHVGALVLRLDTEGVTDGAPDGYGIRSVSVEEGDPAVRREAAARWPSLGDGAASAPLVHDPAFATLFRDYSRRRCEEILGRHGIRLLERP